MKTAYQEFLDELAGLGFTNASSRIVASLAWNAACDEGARIAKDCTEWETMQELTEMKVIL